MPGKDNGRVFLNVTYLKHLRKKKGLTQDELALECRTRRLSVSISSIKRAESGQKVLYRTALNLARYYGVGIADILAESEIGGTSSTRLPFRHFAGIKPSAAAIPVGHTDQAELDITTRSQYRIFLLIEYKSGKTAQPGRYLQRLNLPFDTLAPHLGIALPGNNCDMDLFRYFRQLCLLLTEKYHRTIRISAQRIVSHGQREPTFPDLHEAIGLTPWGGISVCPHITLSGVYPPSTPATGLSAHLKGWRLISVSERPAFFVGRQWELSQLHACARSVDTGRHGETVYLEGMAGIGKTALIHRFIEDTRIDENQVVLLDLHRLSAAQIAPLQYLVRRLLHLPSQAGDMMTRHGITSSTISVTLQVFVCLMAGVRLLDTERRLLDALGPEQRETGVREALAELVELRRAGGRLLLIIEDVYLADPGFTEIVKALALQTQSKPFLLCLSTRKTGKYFSRPAWLDHARMMEITGLTELESRALCSKLSSTDLRHMRDIHSRALGHPGYLLQMIHAGELTDDFYAAVNCTVEFRLNKLTSLDLFALHVIAVYGMPVSIEQWHNLLGALLDSPNLVCNPQVLVSAQLLKQHSDSYIFVHPIVRESVVSRIPGPELERMEKAVENWTGTNTTGNETRNTPAVNSTSFGALAKKARECAHQFHYTRAFDFYRAAVEVAPADAQAKLFNKTAHCLLSQGKITESITFHQHALDSARQNRGGRYQLDLAKVYDLMGRHEKVMEITQDAGEILWHKGNHSRWDSFAEMHAIRGSSRLYGGCISEARVDYQQALYCSTNTSNPRTRAVALSGLAKCCYAQGRMREARELYTTCLNLCEASSLLSIESEVRAMLTRVHYFQLETVKAIQNGQQAVMLSHHTGNVRAELIARLSLTWILLETKSFKQARQEITAGLNLARRARAPRYIAFLLESKARLLWMMGAGMKATMSINRALHIIREQALEPSIGSWLSATKALIERRHDERYSALKQGEEWLQNPTAIHNALNFYKEAIHTAWQLGDAGLLKKYHSQLKEYNQKAPTKWAELHINQADLMLGMMRGSAKKSALKRFNEKVRGYQMLRLQFDPATL